MDTANPLYRRLFNLLLSFLNKDPRILAQINVYPGKVSIEQDELIFSLVDLLDFLYQFNPSETVETDKMPYRDFQRLLYQSNLNQEIKAHGGELQTHLSTGKVETSLYKLKTFSQHVPIL